MKRTKIAKRIQAFFEWLTDQERSPKKFALSFCMGIFIAFCPFIGLRTVMAFVFSRLFMLNFVVVLATLMVIHNPWTMIPVYGAGYFFGLWLFNCCGINPTEWDPVWLEPYVDMIKQKIGLSSLSLSVFLVGGNVLGIVISIISYPIVKYIFTLLMTKKRSVTQ